MQTCKKKINLTLPKESSMVNLWTSIKQIWKILSLPMLPIKFHCSELFGLVKKVFQRVLTRYNHSYSLCQETGIIWHNFSFEIQSMLHAQFGLKSPWLLQRRRHLKIWIHASLKQRLNIIQWPWHWYVSMFLIK